MFVLIIKAQIADPEFDKFPTFNRPLTTEEEKSLGLKKMVLVKPLICLNWSKKLQKFIFDTLSIGTIVLIDKNEIIRYKVNCGNRLIKVEKETREETEVTKNPLKKQNLELQKELAKSKLEQKNSIRQQLVANTKNKNRNRTIIIYRDYGYYTPYYPQNLPYYNYNQYGRIVRTPFGAVNYPR